MGRLVPFRLPNIYMAPRLLTLLSLVEMALSNEGSAAVAAPTSRSVNFHKGLARMTFADGSGSILLQNFTLADGQICVRASYSWEGSSATGTLSVYPRESFDWLNAAYQLAGVWIAGPKTPPSAHSMGVSAEDALDSEVRDPIGATG